MVAAFYRYHLYNTIRWIPVIECFLRKRYKYVCHSTIDWILNFNLFQCLLLSCQDRCFRSCFYFGIVLWVCGRKYNRSKTCCKFIYVVKNKCCHCQTDFFGRCQGTSLFIYGTSCIGEDDVLYALPGIKNNQFVSEDVDNYFPQ